MAHHPGRILLLIALTALLPTCREEAPDHHHELVLTEPAWFGLGNLTVVLIDPGEQEVALDWTGWNQRDGDAFHVPYEVMRLSAGDEHHVITDRGQGNHRLAVDGEVHAFDGATEALAVRFGQGIEIVPGRPHADVRHVYDEP